jgi:hypothetical protein
MLAISAWQAGFKEAVLDCLSYEKIEGSSLVINRYRFKAKNKT